MVMGLRQWLLSNEVDHWLHLFTFVSLFLIAIGFFYVSYEVLSKPQGVLRGVLIIITHVGLSIFTSVVLIIPLVAFFTWIHIYPEMCTVDALGQNLKAQEPQLILDVVVFTMMIGSLQGVLTARFFSHRDFNDNKKIFLWTDFFIGLVFALVFYFIDDYIVFPTCTLHDAFLTVPDLVQFIIIGAFGSGFWRWLSHENSEGPHTEILSNNANPHAPFSRTDFVRGLFHWLIFGWLSILFWLITSYLVQSSSLWFSFQLDALIGIAAISPTCGISRNVTWKLLHMPGKRLGVIGAIVTIIGFLLGFIEPLLLFVKPY